MHTSGLLHSPQTFAILIHALSLLDHLEREICQIIVTCLQQPYSFFDLLYHSPVLLNNDLPRQLRHMAGQMRAVFEFRQTVAGRYPVLRFG